MDTFDHAIAEKVHLGDHICSIFKTEEQQYLSAVSFLEEGLSSRQKCVYITDTHKEPDIKKAFEAHGIQINDYISSNQFAIITKDQAYLKDNYFDADKMIAFLKGAEDQALKEGFAGLRGTGEMTWALGAGPSVLDKLFDYEIKLNKVLPKSQLAALCQYDENKFPKEFLVKVIRSHPYLIIYGKFYENKYFYSYPDMISKENVPADSYDTMLSLITETDS
jgi:two-component system, chemotaxis family, sensor kinase Cph1